MSVTTVRRPLRVRTLFISDVHLGYKGCRAEYLLDFLANVEAQSIFVIGDLVDFWALKRSFYWPAAHQEVLRTLLTRARTGTRVVYIPGNHDELARDFCGSRYGPVEICRNYLHETADGRRMLLMHGDEFDEEVKFGPLLKRVGSVLYEVILKANHVVHGVRRRFGYGHWSLSDWLKHSVPDARRYISRFEEAAAAEAARRGADGVICGHIHRAVVREIDGVLYCNDGDWVESCSSLIEDFNGRLAVLRWSEHSAVASQDATVPAALEPAA